MRNSNIITTALRFVIALIMFSGAFAYMYKASFTVVPKENQRTIDTVVPFLLGMIAGAGTFYFGSSQGSADKDKADQPKK